jgi:hypothetical protein
MAEVKGKYITLACRLLETKPQAKEAALQSVKKLTGSEYSDLAPEGWYSAEVLESIFKAIRDHSTPITANASIKLIGQKIFPTLDQTVGLPKHLKTPLDFLKYDSESFKNDHRGSDVKQRKIIEAKEGKVILEATSPGYDCTLNEGVFAGILKMCGVDNGEVRQTKCIKKGDQVCEYLITW